MKFSAKCVTTGVIAVLVACSTAGAELRRETVRVAEALVEEYGSIEASPLSTGILYDLVLPLSGITRFHGRPTAAPVTAEEWRQIVSELRRASIVESPLPADAALREWRREAAREHVHPLALLFYHYNRIQPRQIKDDILRRPGTSEVRVPADAFESAQVFAAAPLHSWTYRGESVRFRIDTGALYFTNDGRPIASLAADLDDGLGLRAVPLSGDVSAHYDSKGLKTLRVELTLTDGTRLTAYTLLDVRELRTPDPDQTWALQAEIAYNGAHATGEVYVLLADGHSQITNPVIVSEGFDIGNVMNWDELYAGFNDEGLLETLRSLGYDAIVLNYTDAVTYLQRNALLLETLVDSVNQLIAADQTSILVGPSMGGLTTRYVLTRMEGAGIPHRVRSWITFDSPHRGANIPLGLQYWIDFFASESAEAAAMRDALNAPGARQMLLTHFTSPASNQAVPDPMFGAFYSELAQMGDYPVLPRRVAVSSGSGHQLGLPFSAGSQLILWEYRSWALDITGNIWALHNLQPQTIFYGEQDLLWPLPDRYLTVTVQPTWPWDNAPGGTRNSLALLDSVPAPYGDIHALHPTHCFVPTVSALGLDVTDPFYNIAGDADLYALSPFDSLYYPAENQDHVDVTPENFEWLLYEVAGPLAAPVVVARVDAGTVQLVWSPIAGARSYHIQFAEDPESWPVQYSVTADTAWTDPDAGALKRFYRVTASLASAGTGSQ